MLENKNILLGVSGGIAAYKVLDLCSRLKKRNVNLKIIMTKSATEFVNPLSFETMGRCVVYTDLFTGHHEEVHHIELARWADLMLIAPASANTIAKMAHGIADNILLSTYLACDKDVVIAPAMNTNMLKAKATQRNLKILKDDVIGGYTLENIRENSIEDNTISEFVKNNRKTIGFIIQDLINKVGGKVDGE